VHVSFSDRIATDAILQLHTEKTLKKHFNKKLLPDASANKKEVAGNFFCQDMLQCVTVRWQDYRGNKLDPFPAIKRSDIVQFSIIIRKIFAFSKRHFLPLFCLESRGWGKKESCLAILVSLFFVPLLTAPLSQ
jgi:hypothetical protein